MITKLLNTHKLEPDQNRQLELNNPAPEAASYNALQESLIVYTRWLEYIVYV